MIKPYQYWEQYHNKIVSRRGQWKAGEGVFNQGYDMIEDVLGHYSYMQIVVLNSTGKMPSKALADWLEACYLCVSWPDPRIWCNRIGALAGAARTSSLLASSLGNIASDSKAYGPKTFIAGMRLNLRAMASLAQGDSLEDFVQQEVQATGGKPKLVGFARPIVKGDERIPAMEKLTHKLGFTVGKHLQLAYDIETILMQRFDESMNINGYISGFLCDQNFRPEEAYNVFHGMVSSGVMACYQDTAERREGNFCPLKCRDVSYTGPARRTL